MCVPNMDLTKGFSSLVLVVLVIGAVLGALLLRGYQWLDERYDVRLRVEEVSSP